jgi:RHS repeat-associated protein
VHAVAGSVLEDYKGQGELVFGSGEVELKVDRASTSIGVDLGMPRELVELRLYPDTATHRVKALNLEVWVEEGGEFQKVVGVTTSVEAGSGTVVMRLNEPVISSQVKVHCLYDERDGQDQAKEYAEFKNQASKLLEVRYRVQRTQQNYSYDAKGNRTQVQTTTVEAPGAHTSTLTASYWVQTDRVKRYGEWTYVYDGNGNLVQKGTGYTEGEGFAADSGSYVRYDWDLFGRLEKVSRGETGTGSAVEVARYGYDADGLRVEKTVPGSSGSVVTRWVYGPDGNVVLEQGESYQREYVYAEGKLLGYWELLGTEEQKYYTLTDQVGSVVSTTDESGVEVSKRDYLAFGTEAGAEGTAETVALYTGKEWDGEAGLYYYNARWYDPELGRFISEDPIKDQANWYAYVANNPMTHTDPTGMLNDFHRVLNAVTFGLFKGALEAGERRKINTRLDNFQNVVDSGNQEAIDQEQQRLMDMMEDYNRDIIPGNLDQYGGENANLTGDFESPDPAYVGVEEPHPGVDWTSPTSQGARTPFYTTYRSSDTNQSSHPLALNIPGTDMRIRIKHGDSADVSAVATQNTNNNQFTVFRPGQEVLPYPTQQNPGAIHFHLEMTDLRGGERRFINPLGLAIGTVVEYLYYTSPTSTINTNRNW